MTRSSRWWFVGVAVLALASPRALIAEEAATPAREQQAGVSTEVVPAAPVVRASRFELVDSKGEVRAVLGTDAEGTVGVHLYDQASGKERLCMGLPSGSGGPTVMLLGSSGEVKLALGIDERFAGGVLFIPAFGETVTAQQLWSDEPLIGKRGAWMYGEALGLTGHTSSGSIGYAMLDVGDGPKLDLQDDREHAILAGEGLAIGYGNTFAFRERAWLGMDGNGRSVLALSSPSGMANTRLSSPEEPPLDWIVLESAYGDATSTVAGRLKDFDLACSLLVQQREASVFFRLSSDVREVAGMRADGLNGYGVIFVPFADQGGNPGLYLVKRVNGAEVVLASTTEGFPRRDGRASLTIQAKGDSLTVLENGWEVLKTTDSQFSEGKLVWRVFGDRDHPARAGFRQENLSGSD